MPGPKSYKCGDCGINIGKSQGSIQCKLCKSWFHLHCANIPDKCLEMYKELNQCLFYSCKACSDSSALDCRLNDDVKKFFGDFATTMKNENTSFKKDMMQLLSDFKNEISSCLKEMRTDIMDCRNRVDQIDSSTSAKCAALETEVSILHRRLNRGDIVVAGLPSGLNNLSSAVLSLCKFYKIDFSPCDLNQVHYFNEKRKLLVKFNNIGVRDKLMSEYFKTRALRVKDVLGGDIESRVYLNDHFSPAMTKLNTMCRKLLRLKIIAKYRILNRDIIKAMVTLDDGRCLEWDLAECGKHLAGYSPR